MYSVSRWSSNGASSRSGSVAGFLRGRSVPKRSTGQWVSLQGSRKCYVQRLSLHGPLVRSSNLTSGSGMKWIFYASIHDIPLLIVRSWKAWMIDQRFQILLNLSLPAFDLISGNVSVTGTNAYPTFGAVLEYPALNTLGIPHVRLDFGIGGVVPPHTHPFASETLFVVQGSIYTGFISFDGVLYAETLQKGDIYIFPKGTLHFHQRRYWTCNQLQQSEFAISWILGCSKPAAAEQHPRCSARVVSGNI